MKLISKQMPITKIGTNETELKYVLRTVLSGTISEKDVVNFCHNHTMIPRTTIKSALESCCQTIGHYLSLGYSVKLGEVGIFYPTTKSKAVDSNTEAGMAQLEGINIRFRPNSELLKKVNDATLELDGVYKIVDHDKKLYEKVGSSALDDLEDDDEGNTSQGGSGGNDNGDFVG
ncbi:MAG: hypothetical protein IKJ67_01900 [Bacteroidales bacterium]|nr:hypothetical protein [Bacteroidales bacterium]